MIAREPEEQTKISGRETSFLKLIDYCRTVRNEGPHGREAQADFTMGVGIYSGEDAFHPFRKVLALFNDRRRLTLCLGLAR